MKDISFASVMLIIFNFILACVSERLTSSPGHTVCHFQKQMTAQHWACQRTSPGSPLILNVQGSPGGPTTLTWVGGTSGKEPTCPCRRCKRWGFDPGSGRSPRVGRGNLFQYSCLENPMDRGAWSATVHTVTKSQTQLKWLSMQSQYILYILEMYLQILHLLLISDNGLGTPLLWNLSKCKDCLGK